MLLLPWMMTDKLRHTPVRTCRSWKVKFKSKESKHNRIRFLEKICCGPNYQKARPNLERVGPNFRKNNAFLLTIASTICPGKTGKVWTSPLKIMIINVSHTEYLMVSTYVANRVYLQKFVKIKFWDAETFELSSCLHVAIKKWYHYLSPPSSLLSVCVKYFSLHLRQVLRITGQHRFMI